MTSNGEDPALGGAPAPTPVLQPRGGSWLMGVRVIPSAVRSEVRGVYGDRLKVAVNAPPEGGKANARLTEALAKWLDLPPRAVSIESGHGRRDKVVAFSGVNKHELQKKLDRLLRGTG